MLDMHMCAIHNTGYPHFHKHVFISNHCNFKISFSITIIITYFFQVSILFLDLSVILCSLEVIPKTWWSWSVFRGRQERVRKGENCTSSATSVWQDSFSEETLWDFWETFMGSRSMLEYYTEKHASKSWGFWWIQPQGKENTRDYHIPSRTRSLFPNVSNGRGNLRSLMKGNRLFEEQ